MIGHLLFKYHILRALLAWDRDAWEACLARLEKAETFRPLRPFEAAFKAQALLAVGEQAKADDLFARTLDDMGQCAGANDRYIRIFCMLWHEQSFRDLPNANALWAEAMSLDCSRYLTRFLLLRPPPEFRLA